MSLETIASMGRFAAQQQIKAAFDGYKALASAAPAAIGEFIGKGGVPGAIGNRNISQGLEHVLNAGNWKPGPSAAELQQRGNADYVSRRHLPDHGVRLDTSNLAIPGGGPGYGDLTRDIGDYRSEAQDEMARARDLRRQQSKQNIGSSAKGHMDKVQ
jgi:hypothetical protein